MTGSYLVVGGSSGIGAAVAERLIAEGSGVVVLSRHPERVQGGELLRSHRWDAAEAFPAQVLPEVLQGLVYCPGTIRLKPFPRLTEADFREDLEINLLGAVRAVQGCLPALQRAPAAAVVLFSSVAVRTGMPYHASVAAAKGAVEGLVRALAAELAPRIRVNAVAPTITDTPLAARLLGNDEKRRMAAERHPLGRIGDPKETADTVLWLLRAAPMVTAQVIACDGGLSDVRTF